MGSGLSLSHEQVINIIIRDLHKNLKEVELKQDLNRYTQDGYENFYDFSDEANFKNKIKEVNEFISRSDKLYYYYDNGSK